jgi:hypothetical protein
MMRTLPPEPTFLGIGIHALRVALLEKGYWLACPGVGVCPKCHMEFDDVRSIHCHHRGERGCCDVSEEPADAQPRR